MHLQTILIIVGTILGLIYSLLGLTAIKYLIESDEIDKYVGWTLWWCYEKNRYSQPGKILCNYGIITSSLAVISWAMVYFL